MQDYYTDIYRIKPDQEIVLNSIDQRQEYMRYAIINIALLVIAVILAIFTKTFIPCALIAAVCAMNAMRCMKWKNIAKNRMTDISTSEISITDEAIRCSQAADNDTYEKCTIFFSEVQQVVENTEEGEIGFFIYLKEDARLSSIYVNNEPVDRQIFYINGVGYETEKFREMYLMIQDLLSDKVINKTNYQSSWYQMTEKEVWRKLLSPWIFVVAVIGIRFVTAFTGIRLPFF